VLLELPAFPKIPRAHGIVESTGPQLGSISRDIDTGCAIGVTLELSYERLILQVPHGDVSIAATAEADLGIRRDRQGVTRRCRGGQFGLDPRRWTRQIPDAQLTSLTANY